MKRIYTSLLVLLSFTACQDFQEIETNPNQATTVPASLLLTGVENEMLSDSETPWSMEHRWNQYWACNYGYYGNNEYSWTNASLNYQVLKDANKMVEEAKRAGADELNPYSAMAKFFNAYFFVKMTQQVGDIPVTEALQGLENPSPVYNSQKEVYVQVLKLLEEANSDLSSLIASGTTTVSGDILLGGDLTKWQKAVNSFTLRVLISLSKKENDAELNVKGKFASIIGNPAKYPILGGMGDNVQIVYNGTTSLYPTNPGSKGFDKGRYNMAATYVKGLTDLKDPRVFVTTNPANAKIKAGVAFDDFAAYVGASSGESLDDMTFKAGNGEYSFANQLRYYGSFVGPEPALLLGYSEQNFNIAEAINRGWINGSAESFYVQGIKSSMEFYNIADGSTINVTDQDDNALGAVTASVTDYLAQSSVKYSVDKNIALTQILTQKYLSFFQNSGLEAFYNQRRTGVPAFLTGPGTGNGGVIPKRWLYPSAETTTNAANLRKALEQYGNEDSKNADLWSVK